MNRSGRVLRSQTRAYSVLSAGGFRAPIEAPVPIEPNSRDWCSARELLAEDVLAGRVSLADLVAGVQAGEIELGVAAWAWSINHPPPAGWWRWLADDRDAVVDELDEIDELASMADRAEASLDLVEPGMTVAGLAEAAEVPAWMVSRWRRAVPGFAEDMDRRRGGRWVAKRRRPGGDSLRSISRHFAHSEGAASGQG